MPKACLASTRQIITSSQEKDDEDVYSLLGNKSAVWKYLGFPRKDGAVYKQCRYKIKHSGNKTSLARHLAWQTILLLQLCFNNARLRKHACRLKFNCAVV